MVLTAAQATLEDLRPAEEAGLISVAGDHLSFRDQPTRTAAAAAFPARERNRAHQALAHAAPRGSAEQAWHAGCATGSRRAAASAFERSARLAGRGQSGVEVGVAWQRAAEASEQPADAARRYARALQAAACTGDARRTASLWDRLTARTDDPGLLAVAVTNAGGHPADPRAAATVQLAGDLLDAGLRDGRLAVRLAGVAALVTAVDGDATVTAALRDLLDRVTARHRATDPTDAAVLAFAGVVTDPEHPRKPPADLPGLLSGPADTTLLLAAGGAAWLTDDPAGAADLLRRAVTRLHADARLAAVPWAVVALADALLDRGLWEELERLTGTMPGALPGPGLRPARDALAALRAELLTRQGHLPQAGQLLTGIDHALTAGPRLVRGLMHRAAARLAAARGEHERAAGHYAALAGPAGRPVHELLARRCAAEFAAAAVAAGHPAAARAILATGDRHRSGRARWVHGQAVVLLDPPSGDRPYRELLADPVARLLPYDQAVLRTRHADHLRARRRFVQARPQLATALDEFEGLGAAPDADRVRALQRACGVRLDPGRPDGFADLTAQQQRIVRFAADGLTSRRIAQNFGVSPRTIESHLYQIFQKLGVNRRDQLRDVLS